MNVLITGIGSIALKHIAALRKLAPDLRISALRSGIGKREVENIENISSLNELKEQPDFVIISNPTQLHLQTLKDCLVFNCPLFIEKPLYHSIEGLHEIVDEIREKKILTYVACNLRFLDCLVYMREKYCDRALLNEVNAYCGSYLPEWRPGTDFRNSYSADAKMGGGVHLDLIHELDYIYWMFGKPVSITKNLTNQSSLDIPATDYANYCLGFEGFSASVILNYFRRDSKRTLEFVMRDDTILADLQKNEVRSLYKNEKLFSSEQTITDTYFSQMNYFIQLLKSQRKSMNNIEEAFEVLKICLN